MNATSLATLPDRLREIRAEIRDEYAQPHNRPWVVGFSGGKDSTLLLHLVVEAVRSVPPDLRLRPVYVLSNDTGVESPPFQAYVDRTLQRLKAGMAAARLPVEVAQTRAPDEESFWVLLLGKGYPAPNRSFRWCTDRLKIRSTSRFIRDRVNAAGEAVLLLGVRRAESDSRRRRIKGYDQEGERLNPHNDIAGCLIYRPIVDLSDEDVWHVLLNVRSPWGGKHRELVTLYRNAKGGECPFVMTDDDAPACGSKSARFGCWTCTVVEKDNSLEGLIDAGQEGLAPLARFRERLKEVSADPACRSKIRRNGRPGLGPLTIPVRRQLLGELRAVQAETGMELLTGQQVRLIEDWWGRDATTNAVRDSLSPRHSSSSKLAVQ